MTEIIETKKPAPEVNPEIVKTQKQLQFFRTLAIFLGGLIFGVVVLMTIAFAMSEEARKKAIIEVDNEDYVPVASPTLSIPTLSAQDGDEFGTITWLPTPKKIKNPSILMPSSNPDMGYIFSYSDDSTFEVAKFSKGGSLLVTFVSPEGPSTPSIFRLISDKNKYYLVESLISDDYIKKDIDKIFDKSKVKLISYQLKDLFPDYQYSINNIGYVKNKNAFFSPQYITNIKDYAEVGSTPIGPMLVIYSPVQGGSSDLFSRNYYLKLKDSSLISYNQDSVIHFSDDQIPFFNLNDNSVNKNAFSALKVGCGSGFSSTIIKNQSLISDKTVVGKYDQTNVYQVLNSNSALIKYLYDSYKQGREYTGAPPILSQEDFSKSPNHIIIQEKNGDWVLFVNPNFSVQAECGKPVVYLYPEKDTQVSVKVGANITKSEPLYPQNGWTVLAHPNGQLDYQNSIYPNLFWEGTGHGLYPSLGNRGFVVTQSKLISTINSQLKLQGLNDQESRDFMDFWQEKLPKTPYVRLTWLTTQEMNTLAPLKVSPSPQTAIRIFLDFEGLDKPISLTPQKLSAPVRHGFTLVEWGGLLR